MDIIKKLAEELNIGRHQAEAAVKLIDEGTPFPLLPDTVRKPQAPWTMRSCAIWMNG